MGFLGGRLQKLVKVRKNLIWAFTSLSQKLLNRSSIIPDCYKQEGETIIKGISFVSIWFAFHQSRHRCIEIMLKGKRRKTLSSFGPDGCRIGGISSVLDRGLSMKRPLGARGLARPCGDGRVDRKRKREERNNAWHRTIILPEAINTQMPWKSSSFAFFLRSIGVHPIQSWPKCERARTLRIPTGDTKSVNHSSEWK